MKRDEKSWKVTDNRVAPGALVQKEGLNPGPAVLGPKPTLLKEEKKIV